MADGVTGAIPTDEALRCYVGAGDGYVVRRGSRLAVITPSRHPHSSGLVELLTTGPSAWAELVREMAGRITAADYKDFPTIGILDRQNETTAVFLYGTVVASLSGVVERVHLDGSRAVTWVEQSYSGGNYESVELRTSASAEFELATDLGAGVVLGAALRLASGPAPPTSAVDPRVSTPSLRADAPHRPSGPMASGELDPSPLREQEPVSDHPPEPSPAPAVIHPRSVDEPVLHVDAEPEAERFTELRITSLIESPVPAVPVPLLVPDSAAPARQLDSDHTYIVNPDRLVPRAQRVIWAQAPAPTSPVLPPGQVRGVGCPRGHPNRSTDVSCRICGDAVDADGEPIVGPRPPLGWLILDDETTICLDLPCVIGHLPPQDHMISGELARAVTLDDQKHRISRRHLEIHLVGWEARAVDCGSTNGTRFRRAGSRRSGPLKANEPQPLRSGDELELGKRTLTFVDHLP